MRKQHIALQLDIESDSYSELTWRYRIRVLENSRAPKVFAQGRGTPEHVMAMAQNALREARGE